MASDHSGWSVKIGPIIDINAIGINIGKGAYFCGPPCMTRTLQKLKGVQNHLSYNFKKKKTFDYVAFYMYIGKTGSWLTLPCMQNDYLLDITRRSEEKKKIIVSQDIMLYVTEIIKCKNFQFIKVNK